MKTIIGTFGNFEKAEKTITDLKGLGVSDNDISYVASEYEETRTTDQGGQEQGKTVGQGAATGAGTGAAIGAIAGLVVANGLLPGIGTLFVAGPIATALGLTGAAATTVSGAVTGAVAGGLIGALGAWGVSKEDAKMYEEKVRSGEALIMARINEDHETKAKSVYTGNGADEVRIYSAS